MQEKKTEGILLKSIPYLGRKKILKVLTKNEGMLSFITNKKELSHLSEPFLEAEWVYRVGKSDLYPLLDGSILNDFHKLKESFEKIKASSRIAKLILDLLLPEKKAPALYALTKAYLQKLEESFYPTSLFYSFGLKLLLHEGLLSLEKSCTECQNPSQILHVGESYCLKHGPQKKTAFTEIEWNFLETLTFSRSFSEIQKVTIKEELKKKLDSCLLEHIHG